MTDTLNSVLHALDELIDAEDGEALAAQLKSLQGEDVGYLAARLSLPQLIQLAQLLCKAELEVAAHFIAHLPETRAAELLNELRTGDVADIVGQLQSNDRADVLGAMGSEQAQAVLKSLAPKDAAKTQALIAHDPATAGGLMITEYLVHPFTASIQSVLSDLRDNAADYARYDVQYMYVSDVHGRLEGVIRLRDLVLTPGEQLLDSILIANPAHVKVDATQEQLDAFFDEHQFFAAPVVDKEGLLVGVVRRDAVEEARAERADRTLLAFGGIVGGEELRSMPTGTRILRRLMFLCPNILLNLLAASVIALYEPTIAAVTALAIFLPMLSDMSGCAGNQAVAVSIRELSLGVLKPRDILRTLRKEMWLGVSNGVVLGSIIGAIAWVMRGKDWPLIGVVVGSAMCLNSLVAVVIGGGTPLLLKRAGIDPALAASPILTTVTDMCGFFLTLSLATALLLGR